MLLTKMHNQLAFQHRERIEGNTFDWIHPHNCSPRDLKKQKI